MKTTIDENCPFYAMFGDVESGLPARDNNDLVMIMDELSGELTDSVYERMFVAINTKLCQNNIAPLYQDVLFCAYNHAMGNDEGFADAFHDLIERAKEMDLRYSEVKALRVLSIQISVFCFVGYPKSLTINPEDRFRFLKNLVDLINSYLVDCVDLSGYDSDPDDDDMY